MDMTFGSTSWSPGKDRRLTKGMEMRDLAFQADWIHVHSFCFSSSAMSLTSSLILTAVHKSRDGL